MPVDLNDPEVKAAIKKETERLIKEAIDNEVVGLTSKNEELLGKLKKASESKGLTEAEKEELKTLKEASEKAAEERSMKAGEFDKLKEQLIAKHAEELVKRDDEMGKMKQSLEKNLIDAAATKAIVEAGGSPELLLPHIRTQMRVAQNEAGEYVSEIVDASGTKRIGDKDGSPMTTDQLIASLKENATFQPAFGSSGASGSGGSTNNNPPPGSNGITTISNDPAEFGNNLEGIANGDVVVQHDNP